MVWGVVGWLGVATGLSDPPGYLWLGQPPDSTQTLAARVAPPPGGTRPAAEQGSFAAWLRGLPLRPGRPEVRLFNGRPRADQSAHHAVFDLDVGERDLQQCADAVIRLRAEFLRAGRASDRVRFRLTNGEWVPWDRWRAGERPHVSNNRLKWAASAPAGESPGVWRRYLNFVFAYAGTHSLQRQLRRLDIPAAVQPGDVYIQGGFPGHAVLVVDLALDPGAGRRWVLLAQSYMPAQDFHLLRNPARPDLCPWYELPLTGELVTPDWVFQAVDLHTWPDD